MRESTRSRLGYAAVLVPIVVVAVVLTARFMDEGDWVTVASMDELQEEGVVYSDDLKIFVVERDSQPLALSAANPHLGTYLRYCPRRGQFQGRHGERFDQFGMYYGGPAPRSMDRVAVRMFGDEVQVLPNEITRGPPRPVRDLVGPAAQEPRGSFCPDSPSGAGGIYGRADS